MDGGTQNIIHNLFQVQLNLQNFVTHPEIMKSLQNIPKVWYTVKIIIERQSKSTVRQTH